MSLGKVSSGLAEREAMKVKAALIALVAALPLSLIAGPAQAAVPRQPITCGMVVRSSVHLYLTKNLHCTTSFGVRVEYPEAEGGPIPEVTVDLKGHRLSGPGTADSRGITAFAFPSQAFLKVTNGRVENWGIGVGGDSDTRISKVALIDNQTGFFCNGSCLADQLYVRNSGTGMIVGGEASAVVKRSTFLRNGTGIAVTGFLSSAQIERNRFIRNDTAVFIACNSFATLSRNRFIKNDSNVNQQSCE